uniref:Gustatory receptor n=1 Tax=Anopheles melas TaxID=34690 RepID=A0A182UJL7_9DIPT
MMVRFCTVWLQDTLSFATFVDALLIRSLVLVEFTVRYGTVVLCFYQLLRHEVSLHRYVQRFIVIGKSVVVRCSSRSYASVQRMVYALVAKMLIADVGLCTLFAMNSGIKRHETSAHVYRTVNIYVVMMSSQITNLLLLMLLAAADRASTTLGRALVWWFTMSHDVAITKAVLVLIKCFGQLYGILPLASNAFTFERSRPVLWYSRAIALLLMVIYPCAYIVLLTDHEFPILAFSYYLVMLQFTLNYIIVGVLYLHVLFNPTPLMHVLNELIERTRALLRHIYPPAGESPVGRRLFFKTVAIDLLQSFTWYGTFIWLQRKFGATYMLAFWLNSIAVMQTVAALNILLATLLWGAFLYRLINERVRTVIGSLLQLDDTDRQVRDNATSRERRFICNHIYLQLTILRTHHSALTKCIQNIVEFYNTPLALIMLYQFLIIISELFRTLNGGGCHRWKGKSTKKNVLKLALKMILCDTLLCALFVLYFEQFFIQDGDIQSQILWTLNIFSEWQSAIFTNLIVVTLIIGIFYAYTSIVQDIKNDVDVPLGTYMSSILFAVFEAIQFYYIVSASSEITEEAEKTGVLLNEFLPTDPNPRVERCMIATITSYLIMLVQFQLAEI